MIKTIPMIPSVFPELYINDLLSVQPMTSDVSQSFIFKTSHIDNKPELELDWNSYGFLYKSDLFDPDYTVFSTTFEKIEEKNKRELENTIGNIFTVTYKGEVTIETIEEKDLKYITRYVPYIKFKEKYQDGDTVVYFKSPPFTWRSLSGREGYGIIRKDKLVDAVVTCLN